MPIQLTPDHQFLVTPTPTLGETITAALAVVILYLAYQRWINPYAPAQKPPAKKKKAKPTITQIQQNIEDLDKAEEQRPRMTYY